MDAPVGFGPTSLVTTVDGVDWFPADEVTFVAVGRTAWVEVTIPTGRSVAGVLVDLGPAVSLLPLQD